MSNRSLKKPPYIHLALFRQVMKMKASGKQQPIKTKSRSSVIIPEMVGMVIQVYNGMKYISITINEDIIGYKLGEFAPTRIARHNKSDK